MNIEPGASYVPSRRFLTGPRVDPNPSAAARPFSDVAASEAMELSDYLGQTALRAYDLPHRYWTAHIYFARHAARSLSDGDLWTAQRAAAIATYALNLFTRHGGVIPQGSGEPAELS